MKASIIIPTFNRDTYLERTISALTKQDFSSDDYEILVCDNGSTDRTKEIVFEMQKQFPDINLKYFYEPVPGSLSARHRGYEEAKSDNILIFTDDDVLPVKSWLSTIVETFERNPGIHMLGGPSIPLYEATPPKWLEYFFYRQNNIEYCGDLSLLQVDTKSMIEIDPNMVWSLNMSIRKKTFEACKGLHLCVMPKEYQHFQGDGETGLTMKMKEKGYKTFYHPEVSVEHIIPKERLTFNYFDNRYFYQGICNSYTDIRRGYGLYKPLPTKGEELPPKRNFYRDLREIMGEIKRMIIPPKPKSKLPQVTPNEPPSNYEELLLKERFRQSYYAGYNFHQWAVNNNKKLLAWVLKEDYFDYKLPEIK